MNRKFIKTVSGNIINDDLASECRACLDLEGEQRKTCPIDQRQARTKKIITSEGETFVCSKKQGFVQSSKHFSKLFESCLMPLSDLELEKKQLESKYSDNFRRMVHNLVSHNAHILQEIADLVPEKDLMHGHRQLSRLKNAIESNQNDVAKSLLNILQSAIGIKHEITVYNQLFSESDTIKQKKHRIHSLFMNSVYKFFQDFNAKNIDITVGESNLDVLVDFDSLSVSLYHILQNATKYARPGSHINVEFEKDSGFVKVSITMQSLKISKNDLTLIYDEKYSGEYARKLHLSGSGYGMFVVSKLLARNNARIRVTPNIDGKDPVYHSGFPYEMNQIDIYLKLAI